MELNVFLTCSCGWRQAMSAIRGSKTPKGTDRGAALDVLEIEIISVAGLVNKQVAVADKKLEASLLVQLP
jgi:hypothetical protein